MAASDETIDPNDLDSIDALLDEAELEVAEKKETADSEDQDAIDSLLDEVTLPESIDEANSEELEGEFEQSEDELLPDIKGDDSTDLVQGNSIDLEKKQSATNKAVSEEEAPYIEPVAIQSNPTQEMTAEDMDSIKKLIIIFGSVLVVLVLIGIGIGVWSVFASKGSALGEETKTLIESTQVSTERIAGSVMDSKESIQVLEKKIDALNFQLEALSTDLLSLKSPVLSANKLDVIDPLGLNTVNSIVATTKATPSINPAVVASVKESSHSNSEAVKLADSVNKKMISAQRRIDEVNRRVKDIQSKHKLLLLNIKNLEKQLVLQQKKVAAKEQEEKVKKQAHNPYQYSAPDEAYYDQSVGDSYP